MFCSQGSAIVHGTPEGAAYKNSHELAIIRLRRGRLQELLVFLRHLVTLLASLVTRTYISRAHDGVELEGCGRRRPCPNHIGSYYQ